MLYQLFHAAKIIKKCETKILKLKSFPLFAFRFPFFYYICSKIFLTFEYYGIGEEKTVGNGCRR